MNDTKNFLMVFNLTEVRPDDREFRMNSTLFTVDNVKVGIKVPRDTAYVLNLEDIIQAELSAGGTVPDPILTVAGSVYVLQQFEEAYKVLKVTAKVDTWESVAETEKSVGGAWDSNPYKETVKEEKWDDKKEDW